MLTKRQDLRGWLLDCLAEIRPEEDYAEASDFVKEGLLDSMEIVLLVGRVDEHFGVSIAGHDIKPENFRNLTTISELLRRSGAGA